LRAEDLVTEVGEAAEETLLIGERIQVVDLINGEHRFALPGRGLAFAPDGRSFAIARSGPGKQSPLADGRVRGDNGNADATVLWIDAQTGHTRREIAIAESHVSSLAFAPEGQYLAAGCLYHSKSGVIHIYRLRDKREIETIATPSPRRDWPSRPTANNSSRACSTLQSGSGMCTLIRRTGALSRGRNTGRTRPASSRF
jgi:WD40 repeat protein